MHKKWKTDAAPNNAKKIMLKNSTKWVSWINNTQVDDGHDIDVVMPMYNLIEYCVNYFKKIWNFIAIL